MDEADGPEAGVPDRRSRVAVVVAEAVALLVVVSLTLAKLAAVEHSAWRSVFLANGDSLTLPLVLQSLERGEPFHWVFSSQTFFFPELPIYLVCGLIAGSAQGGLVLNAVVNVVLLYWGFRAVAAALLPRHRLRQALASLGAIVLFLIAVLTESDVRVIAPGTVEPARIGTVFLLTTYYSGAILVGFGMLALALWLARGLDRPARLRRLVVYGAVVLIAGTATAYSDPIYLLYFGLPFCGALVVMVALRRVTLRWALILGFPQILAMGLGNSLRLVFPQFVGAALNQYLASYGARGAVEMLGKVLADWLGTPAGVARLVIVLAPILFCIVLLGRQLRHRGLNDPRRATNTQLLLMVFIVASSLSLVVGVIVTGQSVTRYLVPLYLFPPLVLLLIPAEWMPRWGRALPTRPRARVLVAGVVAVASVAALTVASPSVAALAATRAPVDVACLDDWLAGRPLNGAGDFWTVRALTLYASERGAIVQIDDPANIHVWMNNLWLYDHREFSYVIANEVMGDDRIVTVLGQPTARIRCDGYQIYDYVGTPAADKLTRGIRRSAAEEALSHHY